MDADDRPILPADELIAVTEIDDLRFRSELMDRILASMEMEQHKIPEESFIRLLHTRDDKIIRRILDKNVVTGVTTAMLASAYDLDTMSRVLEYDPSYAVTSATIDAIQTKRKKDARDMVETLLLRSPSLQPTESQVCRALAAENSYARYAQHEKPRLLDLVFTRDPDFLVTQEMLEAVCYAPDLAVLLAHVVPGKHVLTDRILTALTCRHKQDLLRMFLDFEPTAKVSSEIAQPFFKYCDLDTVECLLDHDSGIVILPGSISDMIRSPKIYNDEDHCRLIEILENTLASTN